MNANLKKETLPVSTQDLSAALFDHLLTGVVLTDKDLNILKVNLALETMLQVSERKLKGSNINKIFKDEHFDLIEMTSRAKEQVQTFAKRDISIKTRFSKTLIDVAATPVEIGPVAFIFEIHAKDRQSRIQREEQLAQQHNVTRQLIRGVAHEIKNPLASIRGAAQLLLRAGKKKQILDHEFLDIIIQESDRLKGLADTLLGSNRLPKPKVLNIHEPIEHVIKLVQAQHTSVHIERDYDLSLPELRIDRNRMIQVFLNISLNAVNAVEEHKIKFPALKFKTRIEYHVTAHGQVHKHMLNVSIEDNGPGIPAELVDTLFYPMVTGRAKGTGLGLSIAQDIVLQHGGFIEFETDRQQPNTFTIFKIYLPIGME